MQFVPATLFARLLAFTTVSAGASFPVHHGGLSTSSAATPLSAVFYGIAPAEKNNFVFKPLLITENLNFSSIESGFSDISTRVAGVNLALNDKWSLQTSYLNLDIGTLNRQQVEVATIRTGYFIDANWQVGAGVQHKRVASWGNDDTPIFWEVSDIVSTTNETAPLIFTRYILPGSAPGEQWQMGMSYVRGNRERTMESSVVYQPHSGWLVGAHYKNVDNLIDNASSDIIKFTVGHHFTDNASMQLIFESDLTNGGTPTANIFGVWVF